MNPEYIVTLSTSYAGSTILDLLMGAAMKGVRSVGEAHWLIDRPEGKEWAWICSPCRENRTLTTCPLTPVTEAIMRGEIADLDLYPAIWEAFHKHDGSTILHTSDKVNSIRRRFIPDDNNRSIVLWKQPKRAWGSVIKHRGYGVRELFRYANTWHNMYADALRVGKLKVVVSYERFVRNPARQLQRIARVLDLEYDPTWIDTWHRCEDLHRVVGNQRPFQLLKEKGPWIGLDQDFKKYLTSKELCRVKKAWEPYQSLLEQLQELSKQ